MSSFGELLTEYMTRTGISDSELARHLGVSRQTIFRWKEGLTARPRVREDVLRCAERLRLSASESDALLLAAGFAPEHLATTDDPLTPPTEIALHAQNDLTTAQTIVLPQTPRKNSRARWFALLLVVVALFGAAWLLLAFPDVSKNAVALVVPPTATWIPSPTPTPLPPEWTLALARLNSRGGQSPPYDVTARLRQTLEREIATEAIANVRLIDVSDTVRDADTAERVRERAGADMIVWGNFSGSDARVEITNAPRVPFTGTLLSAFPLPPRDQSVTLDMNDPTQTHALGLLTTIPLHLARGNVTDAQRAYETAQASGPRTRELRAALDFYFAYLAQTTAPLRWADAAAAYGRALDATSVYEGYLNRGLVYLAQNQTVAAKNDFVNAQALDALRPEAFRALCWAFVLEQQPQATLSYCDDAVARDRTAWSLDARAAAYAQLGRYAEAANEFSGFLRWLDSQPASAREMFAPTRRAWMEKLRAGRNPFDAPTLQQLRGAP